MGHIRECLRSLFRRDGPISGRDNTPEKIIIQRPLFGKRVSTGGRTSEQSQCTVFEPPHPYSDYEAYNSTSRQYINSGTAHIFKTFPSDALVPLEEDGIGRLKAFYEAWLPKRGLVTRDRISGIYALVFISSSRCEGSISCGGTTINRSLRKHYAQCTYAGTGVRRGCSIVGDTPSTGMEVWIKGSLPVTGPWIQTMYIPPDQRLNKMCLIAAPKMDFMSCVNTGNALVEMPELVAGPGRQVFELDSDVYIYVCRLSPCSSISYTVASTAKGKREPPMYECPRIHRSATAPSPAAIRRPRRHHGSPKPGKDRSLFLHMHSNFAKDGHTHTGGSRLLLPDSVQLFTGDAIHLKSVTPGAEINIKSTGFDRAQFILIDMPGYEDDEDAKSI